ncbi:MAG: FecR domain-containing protein [Nitrosomonadales bacterium]|nr:FecR domain-containing protein [Nitrosomonadales bacterium]
MMRLSLLALLTLLFAPAASAAGQTIAGTVVQIRGAAFANHLSSSESLAKGTKVLIGDRIVTGRNARLALKMKDGAVLTLGADTEFAINEYRYSPRKKQGSASLELIKGAFRAVTGAIGKLKGRDFKVKTAAGVIGIRGTDFWGGFHFSEALDVALLGGAGIYIENAAGRIEITQPGDGTTVQNANTAPSAPVHWGDQKLNAAKQSVSWD